MRPIALGREMESDAPGHPDAVCDWRSLRLDLPQQPPSFTLDPSSFIEQLQSVDHRGLHDQMGPRERDRTVHGGSAFLMFAPRQGRYAIGKHKGKSLSMRLPSAHKWNQQPHLPSLPENEIGSDAAVLRELPEPSGPPEVSQPSQLSELSEQFEQPDETMGLVEQLSNFDMHQDKSGSGGMTTASIQTRYEASSAFVPFAIRLPRTDRSVFAQQTAEPSRQALPVSVDHGSTGKPLQGGRSPTDVMTAFEPFPPFTLPPDPFGVSMAGASAGEWTASRRLVPGHWPSMS